MDGCAQKIHLRAVSALGIPAQFINRRSGFGNPEPQRKRRIQDVTTGCDTRPVANLPGRRPWRFHGPEISVRLGIGLVAGIPRQCPERGIRQDLCGVLFRRPMGIPGAAVAFEQDHIDAAIGTCRIDARPPPGLFDGFERDILGVRQIR